MKVVILCGGLGTRLREEAEFRPTSAAVLATCDTVRLSGNAPHLVQRKYRTAEAVRSC